MAGVGRRLRRGFRPALRVGLGTGKGGKRPVVESWRARNDPSLLLLLVIPVSFTDRLGVLMGGFLVASVFCEGCLMHCCGCGAHGVFLVLVFVA